MRKINPKLPKKPRPMTEARKDKQAATVLKRKAKYDALRREDAPLFPSPYLETPR